MTRPGAFVLALTVCMAGAGRPCAGQETVELRSSHEELQTGFAWAREQALAYAFDRDDPVGPWYEAALPGREAFCMRDVAHQLTGGLVLGLWPHTRNMLEKFAESIAASRQWAGYWEIDRLDRPAPVDYRSDEDFWYNLPANFDVADATVRAWEWTGDRSYLGDPVFREFRRITLEDYVAAWDPDGDGIQESGPENGIRGIPTYWEGDGPRAYTGGDLVAAQYAATRAAARAHRHLGDSLEASRLEAEAHRLRRLYNDGWWNEELGRFNTSELPDGRFDDTLIPLLQILPVYYGIVDTGTRLDRLVDDFPSGDLVEVNVYRAEALYRAGRHRAAFDALLAQMDPHLPRREYPENPFTAVGTAVRWLAGVEPRAHEGLVETRPRLPPVVDWIEVAHVPTFAGKVGVRHDGNRRSRLTNEGDSPLHWRAVLPGHHPDLVVDDAPVSAAHRRTAAGAQESAVVVEVPPHSTRTVGVPAAERTFTVTGMEVTVEGDLGGFALSVNVDTVAPGLEVARVRLTGSSPAPPPPLSLRWSLPSRSIQGQWTTAADLDKSIAPDWAPSQVRSALARHAPVLALFGGADANRLTVAASNALDAVRLHAAVREEDARIHAGVDLFTERHPDVASVEVDLRFDTRPVALVQALADVSSWWASRPGYAPMPVPEVGRLPMYSTWYGYHQDLDPERLLEEVEAAKALGFEAIIVDDGWQTLDSRRGYAFTGDWRPERIPDMRGFVDEVHRRGMKFLLWYAVPLVGERSDAFTRFRGKFLRYWNGQGAYELDPRYPEVRAHVIETYRNAMREWGVDGFKLDFLGRFVANENTVLERGDGRDHASVNEATDRLMTDVVSELRAVEPDLLIEFRQPYIGPKMRTYGNLFRATDSPNSQVANRVRVVDLRLLSGTTAVHSDMLMWSREEPVEEAALQLLAVLFAVPQISVRLGEIPEDHLRMVRHYTGYWRENRGVLLDGIFEPRDALANYPLVTGRTDEKLIAVAYADVRVPLERGLPAIDVLNASGSERLVVDAVAPLGRYRYRAFDATGTEASAGVVTLDGPHAFAVPRGGLLTLARER